MRRFLFVFLFLPQLVLAQYNAKCFRLDATADTKQVIVRQTITEDAEIPFGVRTPISGLSVSGRVVFENDDDSYVRVIMKDDYNYEHLVYENYPLLADGMSVEFQNIAMETRQLDGIIPSSVRVELMNATLTLESLSYNNSTDKGTRGLENPTVLQKEQSQYIVDKLNENLSRHNKTWRASMTSIAEKTFEEKKILFGGKLPQLFGFEYYAGGIFVMPGALQTNELSNTRSVASNNYVSEWDWRNRHGKNWMTSVKNQGVPYSCGSCWAFSAIGSFEAYINLYYNQLLNYDLSEQELISCSDAGDCGGGHLSTALSHIRDYGAIPEDCFPYSATNDSCHKCANPFDVLSFEQHHGNYMENEDSLKKAIFRCPLACKIPSWNHYVVLAGFKQIHSGEYYFTADSSHYTVPIQANDSLVGHPAWLIKNSWGHNWGNNGYGYVAISYSKFNTRQKLLGNVTSQRLNENNIVCEDADGDGYYFWGIGSKPSYCPSWVPDIKDGNDDNYSKGKLLLENTPIIGELETLNPNGNPALVINSNTTYTTRQSIYSHIRITSGGKLTIRDILNLFGRVTVTIESSGELVIDGGVVTNADIYLAPGGKITLKNGGKLVMRTNMDFIVPTGALADIQHGEILRSNDY